MIDYHTTTDIWLHLEEYYNKGLSPEEAKEIIEGIVEPFQFYIISTGNTLRTKPMGINGNLIVESNAREPQEVRHVVALIEDAIRSKMFGKSIKATIAI